MDNILVGLVLIAVVAYLFYKAYRIVVKRDVRVCSYSDYSNGCNGGCKGCKEGRETVEINRKNGDDTSL